MLVFHLIVLMLNISFYLYMVKKNLPHLFFRQHERMRLGRKSRVFSSGRYVVVEYRQAVQGHSCTGNGCASIRSSYHRVVGK